MVLRLRGTLHASALGETPYREGLALQDVLVALRANGDIGDWVLYPDHESVLTIGRNPSEGNLLADAATLDRLGVEVFEVPRGGDVTWHGPGQLVGYPVVSLDRVDRDLHRWLRALEEAIIVALAAHDLEARRVPGRTGVWLDEHRKIASIGVAVRRWVGYHGFALNVCPDLAGFELIHPCGLHGIRMTSMHEALGGRGPSLAQMRHSVTEALAVQLGYEAVRWAPPEEPRQLARASHAAAASNETSTPSSLSNSSGGSPPWSP